MKGVLFLIDMQLFLTKIRIKDLFLSIAFYLNSNFLLSKSVTPTFLNMLYLVMNMVMHKQTLMHWCYGKPSLETLQMVLRL